MTGSGGSLFRFDGEVSLEFAANQDIEAAATPNADLDATLPTGANYETYMVDNTAPTLTIMPVDASTATFTATILFSEDVNGFGGDGDATATNAALGTLTKGGDERTYTVLVTVSNPSASVSISLKVVAGKAADLAGNYNAATSRDIEYTAPATTPGAPTITSVMPGNAALTVTWTAPANNGGSAVTGYDVQHKLSSAQDIAANWTEAANTGDDLSHTIGSLANGTSYDVQVRAVNIAGDGAWSATTDGAPRTTPEAPAITGVTPGNATLTVTWTAPASNGGSAITGYDVRHKLTSAQDIDANWTEAANTGDDLSHTIGSLANGTSYDVQVRAVNIAGDGAWSATTEGAPRTTPEAPTISDVTPGNAMLTVTWAAPSSNGGSVVTGYDVRHKLTSAQDIAANWTEAANTGDDLSHTIGSLTNGTSYDVQVRAVNIAGDGAWSDTTDGTPRTTPEAPTITSVTPGNASLTVTWTASASNGGSAITGYDVRHKLSSAPDIAANWTVVANTGDDLSHTIGSLTNGTSYDVQVRAVNIAGDGAWSDTTDGTPRTTPEAPTITSVTPGNASLTVTWTASASNGGSAITGYDVRHKLSSAPDIAANWTVVANTGDDLSHTIGSLTNGTSYDVQVRAVNVAGDGAWSDTTDGTPRTIPEAPTIASVTPGNATLTVTWTVPGNGGSAITGYDARHKLSSAPDIDANWTEAANTGDDLSHTIGSLANGTSYDVQVRAVNFAGDGAWSATTDGAPRTTPEAPTITSVTPGNATLTVTWTVPGNGGSAITGYDVRHKLSSAPDIDANWTEAANTGDDLSHTIGSLTNGTSYDIQVRAVNVAGDGAWSSTSVGIPVEAPGAPAAPTVAADVGELTVTWTTPADVGGSAITGYDVRHKLSSAPDIAANWTEAANTGDDLSHTISGLANDTQYDVQVRAVNAEGDGVWSATTTGRPRTTPAAPAAPTLRPGNGQLTVDWTASADGGATIIAYDMRHKLTSAPESDASWVEVDNVWRIGPLTAAITGLANGMQYDVQVRAMNSAGDSAWSATSTGTPAATGPTPAPGAPGPPVVTAGNRTLIVRWSAPVDEGSAPITAYDLRHRPSGGGWTIVDSAWTSGVLRHAITDLSNGAQYEVQVRAVSAAGASGWSTTTAGIPTAPPLPPPPPEVEDSGASSAPPLPQNQAPAFAEGIYTTRSVAENAVVGAHVGRPVVATDADGDRLTYALSAALNYVLTAADVDFFAIDQATGQITVRPGTTLDYETKATYVVVVSVRDGKGDLGEADNAADDSITVAIEVTNVELPGVASAYDADFNEVLDRDEVLKAIDDYFRDGINKEEMLETVGLYVPG